MSRKELDQEVVDGLRKSLKVLRPVYPIVKSKRTGRIVDGLHRYEAGPTTYEKYCVELDMDEKEEILYRIHLNFRRKVSREERKRQLIELARVLEKQGVTRGEMVSEITKMVPFTERWVRELLPDKYKMVEKAREVAEVTSAKPEHKPEPAPPPEPRVEVHEYEPEETWEFREARMHPEVSRMEFEVVTELMAEGLPLEMDREFCLESTKPDAYHPGKNLAIYIDGPVHKGREERDEGLRELLRKRYGCRVLVLRFEDYSKSAKEEIKRRIRKAVSGEVA
ncbi:MAG: hypothetical protein ACE5Z5_13465 [Candidatus Bathyarchaeia archaeon]